VNLAWAIAKLGVLDPPLIHAISAAAMALIPQFDAQHISNTSWAFATLDVQDQPLSDALSA